MARVLCVRTSRVDGSVSCSGVVLLERLARFWWDRARQARYCNFFWYCNQQVWPLDESNMPAGEARQQVSRLADKARLFEAAANKARQSAAGAVAREVMSVGAGAALEVA